MGPVANIFKTFAILRGKLDLILLGHALIVRPHLFVSKNPEKPKKVSVDLTRHTYDGMCKRLVHDAINVLVFVVLDVCTGL